jgi:hypothetical protein
MGNGTQLRPQRNVQFVCVEGNLISVEVRNSEETPCVGSIRRIILCFEMGFWTPLLTVVVGSADTDLCVFPAPAFLQHRTAVVFIFAQISNVFAKISSHRAAFWLFYEPITSTCPV